MSGYPFLTLTGTARERGYQYGSQVPELIKKNIAFYRTMFEGFGVPWETAGKISKKFEPFIRDYYPEALEEIAGVAEGANLLLRRYSDYQLQKAQILFCETRTAARASEFWPTILRRPYLSRSNLGLAQTGSRHDGHFGSSC